MFDVRAGNPIHRPNSSQSTASVTYQIELMKTTLQGASLYRELKAQSFTDEEIVQALKHLRD